MISETSSTAAGKGLKPWEKPMVSQIDLTEDELSRLRASEDPMASLFETKPELGSIDKPG